MLLISNGNKKPLKTAARKGFYLFILYIYIIYIALALYISIYKYKEYSFTCFLFHFFMSLRDILIFSGTF